ncbi:MAG: insulinase family protein [Treponema sp.]|nr:insulinase family protein [Treponema sp.]
MNIFKRVSKSAGFSEKSAKSRKVLWVIIFFLTFIIGKVFTDNTPLFVLPVTSLYGDLGSPEDSLPAKAALRTGTLGNGLRYYILENSLPAGRAYLTLAVNAGSILENDDEQGLAHFVEHMAFNGTRRFPGMELINYLRSLGMRFGPEVNAYTSFDETIYGIETPVEQDKDGIKRIPDRALAIIDDWTWAITFDPNDVDKERSVIMEEYRTRLGAQERVRRQVLPLIFRGSLYADRLPIGLPEIIQNAPTERLIGFYQRWYRPDNMAIIFVGDFNGEVLEKELAAHFSAPAADIPLSRPYFELPDPQKGTITTAVVTDEELPSSTVYLYYKRSPQARLATLEAYRESLIDYLIEMMLDFRYEEYISAGNSPYMAAGSWNSRYGQSSRYYIMAANSKAGRSGETLVSLLMEKERILRYGFTRSELERAKGALLSDLERIAAEKDRRESERYLNELTADFFREQYALDPEWELYAVRQLLPGIGLPTINSTVRSYYAEDDLLVIITGPKTEDAQLPDEEAIIGMAKESRNAEITPPKERVAVSGFLSEVAEPGSIIRVINDESGAEIWELSNGMCLVLMSTANKNNELDFYILARGGIISTVLPDGEAILGGFGFSPEEALHSAKLAAEIQSASGLATLSKPELMDFLSDKQLSLSFWTGTHTRGFRGSSSLRDLPYLFQLLYGSFTQPRIDQNGFSMVLDYHRTRLLQEGDNPEIFFSKELSRLTYSNHPLYMPLELEDLDSVSEKAALTFLNLALNPADFTIVLAGSLGDRDELRKFAEMYLAAIPNNALPRWNSWTDPGIVRPGMIEKIIYKGKEDKCIVYMGYFVSKTWTEADNAVVLALNDYLDIVLTDEIREKLGGVYSIYAGASFSPAPVGELSLEIYFMCDPGRQEELRKAVKEQLALLSQAADEETLARSQEALVKSFERGMENNGFVARNLANFTVITNTPLSHLAERPSLYNSVTTIKLSALTAELLTGGPVELVLLPESTDK